MEVVHRKDANLTRQTRDIFTGEVHSSPVLEEGKGEHLIMNLVSFSPGGRTKWHRHSFEQGLVIVEGRGIVATEEQEHVVVTGDVVYVSPNEKHWHGGTETTGMAHISITQVGETTVLEPVERIRTPEA
jgi:quercetin dioxygenase-like cupin family protein